MTQAKIEQMYNALKRITMYESVKQLRRNSEDRYGLDAHEALEYAYENVVSEAHAGLRGVRMPKPRGVLHENAKPSADDTSRDADGSGLMQEPKTK